MAGIEFSRFVLLCKGSFGDVFPLFCLAHTYIMKNSLQHAQLVVVASREAIEQLKQLVGNYNDAELDFQPFPNLQGKLTTSSSDDERQDALLEEMRHSLTVCEVTPSLVIFNLFTLEGWLIAKHLNIHCVAASPFIVDRPPPAQFKESLRKEDSALCAALENSKAGLMSMAEVDCWFWRLMLDDFGQCCEKLGIDPCPLSSAVDAGVDLPPATPLLYAVSPSLVERQGFWPESISLCGPWLSLPTSSKTPLPTSLAAFLQQCPEPPVYVGFGSMETFGFFNTELCTRLLQEVFSGLSVEPQAAIFQLSRGSLLHKTFLQIAPDAGAVSHFLLLEPLPHNLLLPHCSAAIHHGGSGTCQMCALHSCPQIVCPVTFDQETWAQRLEWLGVGVNVGHPLHLRSASISSALRKMRCSQVRDSVCAIGQKMSSSSTVIQTAIDCIDRVIAMHCQCQTQSSQVTE